MSAKYFISIRPQTNLYHTVHKDGCPFLPDDGKRIFLGVFKSPRDAVIEGKRHFDKSTSCLFCSKENHSYKREHVFAGTDVSENKLSFDCLPVTWEVTFQCCVN